ncbi:MAG: hypothetical protein IKK85_03560 [Clostridia bacterium]|nr:hypothetical protein [Clostridia bacterium]
MSLFANERFSNSNHITAETDAKANNAIIAGNCVFDFGSKFALTVSPAAGTVTVSDGVLSFSGRNCGVILTESAEYNPPPSDTVYTKNIVVLRYSRNTITNIETFNIAVISSDVQESESAAAAIDVSLSAETITESTVTADFPLWSFIATASSATAPVQLFTVVSGIAQLNSILTAVNKALTQEIADRKKAVSTEATNRTNSYNTLNNSLKTTNTNVSANTNAIENLKNKSVTLLSGNTATGGIYNSTQPLSDFTALCFGYKNLEGNMEYHYMPVSAEYIVFPDFTVSGSGLSLKVERTFPRVVISKSGNTFSVNYNKNSGGTLAEIIGIY